MFQNFTQKLHTHIQFFKNSSKSTIKSLHTLHRSFYHTSIDRRFNHLENHDIIDRYLMFK